MSARSHSDDEDVEEEAEGDGDGQFCRLCGCADLSDDEYFDRAALNKATGKKIRCDNIGGCYNANINNWCMI